jgi:hypothetical protein
MVPAGAHHSVSALGLDGSLEPWSDRARWPIEAMPDAARIAKLDTH